MTRKYAYLLSSGWMSCLLALLLLPSAAGFIPVSAGEPEFVVKFAWTDPYDPNNPGAHFTSAYAATLQYQINLLTSGRMRIDLYPAAQLGDHSSTAQQIANGTLEMANINIGVLASLFYPKISVVNAPFIFSSQEHARRAISQDSPLIKNMTEEMADETNLRIISILPNAPRYITNNRKPIFTPDDLKGMKIRTMQVVPHLIMMESLGAIPVPISFAELYTSLQTNVVDGQENPLMNIEAQKFYQVQKYVSMTGHIIDMGTNVISDKFYRSLPDDLRAAFVEAERVAQLSFIAAAAIFDCVGVDRLAKQGMQFNYLTPAQIQAFRDRCIPAVRKHLEEELGREFVDEFMRSVDAAKQSIVDESKIKR